MRAIAALVLGALILAPAAAAAAGEKAPKVYMTRGAILCDTLAQAKAIYTAGAAHGWRSQDQILDVVEVASRQRRQWAACWLDEVSMQEPAQKILQERRVWFRQSSQLVDILIVKITWSDGKSYYALIENTVGYSPAI